MTEAFDPYHRWLGIPPKDQPPNHYRLLGLERYESNLDVIESAADRQMAHVRGFQSGQHADDAQRLLNEISAAKVCLLKPEEKSAYDRQLKQQLDANGKQKSKPLAVAQPLDESSPKPAIAKPNTPQPNRAVAVATHAKHSTNSSGGLPLVLIAGVGGAVAGLVLLVVGGGLLIWLANDDPRPPVNVVENPPAIPEEDDDRNVPRVDVSPPVRNNPDAGDPTTNPPDRNPPIRVNNPPATDPPPTDPPITNPPTVEPWEDVPPNGHLLALLTSMPEAADTRTALPAQEDRDAKAGQIADIFPLDEAQTFQQKVDLAKQLLQTGKDSTGDAAAQYVLYEMARSTSAEAGDTGVALAAVDALDAKFQVEGAKLRVETIATAAKASPPSSVKQATIERGIELIDELFGEDEYVESSRLVSGLTAIARSVREGDLVAQLVQRRDMGREMFPAYQAAQQAIEQFQQNPEDADAASAIGKFFALVKGDWQRGLPFLAAGSDEELKQLAEQEMAVPSETSARRKLADAWYAAGQSSDGIAADRQMARAAMWYERIAGDVSGLTKVEIQRRLDELASVTLDGGSIYDRASAASTLVSNPPELGVVNPPSQQPIDLFSMIDLPRDRLSGAWRMEDEKLISPQTYGAVLKLSGKAPDEYQIVLHVERKSGKNAFLVGLTSQGNQFQALLGYDERRPEWGHVNALEDVDGGRVTSSKNHTTTKGYPFPDEATSTVICTVRENQITVTCDGKRIIEFQGDPSRLSMPTYWAGRLRGHTGLWIGTYACSFAISKIELTPLSGNGESAPPREVREPTDVVFLDDLQETSSKVGYGNLGKHGQQGYLGAEAVFQGKSFEHALSMHGVASGTAFATYQLDGSFKSFAATVGVLDPGGGQPHSAITFQVVGDGKVLWKSEPVDRRSVAQECRVNIAGVRNLDLQVLCAGSREQARSAWLHPRISKSNAPAGMDGAVDLLKLVDVEKNAFNGRWKREDDALVSPGAPFSRVEIPYHPPGEYDLEVDLTRVSGKEDISIGLIYQGKQCHVALDRYGGTQTDLMVDMRTNSNGVARHKGNAIPEGSRGKITCQVRKDHIKVSLDGTELFTYRGEPTWTGMNEFWRVNDKQALMIGSHKAQIQVHAITLTPR